MYLNDPTWYHLYNIIDTILVRRLNEKLKHIDLHNTVRRMMRTPMTMSMTGNSALFDTYVFSKVNYVRYGISSENGKVIDIPDIEKYPIPKDNKYKIKPTKISSSVYQSIVNKFVGAYVKTPFATIINDGSLIIDLDATGLYPSMITQSNIGFDSYRARILPPSTYKTVKLLETILGKGQIPDALSSSIFQMIATYVNEEDITKKGQTVTNTYYTFMYLFDALVKSGLPFNKISNPTTTHESILLKTYLLPLLDLVNIIHPSNKSYNQFSFDYIFDEKELENKYPDLYIVHDVGNSNLNLQKHTLAEATKFIKKYIITMAGTLFAKHEEKTGLFADFLQQMGNLRKHYKKTRDSHPKNSDEYSFYDARQTSVKIIMNTTKLMVLILMYEANLVNSGNISSR